MKNKSYLILLAIAATTTLFVSARGNVWEWLRIALVQGVDVALNNPKVDYYSSNNIILNVILLIAFPLLYWLKGKKKSFIYVCVVIGFNLWMLSIDCLCIHNQGRLFDNGDCILNEKTKEPYYNRGLEKYNAGDYSGAIADYTKAIDLDPKYHNAYLRRGIAKANLGGYSGAIADYTKAIELGPGNKSAYRNRGIAKEKSGYLYSACADWRKAAELGDTDAALWVAKQCN